jgi:hypothetical protein
MPSSDVKTMDSTLSESKRYSGLIANFAATDCRKIKVACQIVLQIDIRSGNQIILSDRKALLGSRVALIFDRGWVRV